MAAPKAQLCRAHYEHFGASPAPKGAVRLRGAQRPCMRPVVQYKLLAALAPRNALPKYIVSLPKLQDFLLQFGKVYSCVYRLIHDTRSIADMWGEASSSLQPRVAGLPLPPLRGSCNPPRRIASEFLALPKTLHPVEFCLWQNSELTAAGG